MTSNMLRRFVELTKIPWVESQMGKGVIDARELSTLSPQADHTLQVMKSCECPVIPYT